MRGPRPDRTSCGVRVEEDMIWSASNLVEEVSWKVGMLGCVGGFLETASWGTPLASGQRKQSNTRRADFFAHLPDIMDKRTTSYVRCE